jgi:hypothetical protein
VASFTLRIGLLLVVFGVASYVMTGAASPTALIPSVVGALLVVCGAVATRGERARRHAMHAAAAIALIGIVGTASALVRLPDLFSGAVVPRRPAVIARASMAIILIVYLAVSVKSFVDARVRRKA